MGQEYAATAGRFRTYRADNDGKQVGDPNKAIKVMLKAIDSDKALARAKIAEFTQDIDASEAQAKATDYA